MVASFQKMGLKFDVEQIKKIRQSDEQIRFGVPQKELLGHAFHTYSVDSPDRAVHFEFQHNVSGRQIYADGTADAVAFLSDKNEAGNQPRLYNMFDVLRSGSMR